MHFCQACYDQYASLTLRIRETLKNGPIIQNYTFFRMEKSWKMQICYHKLANFKRLKKIS